MKGHVRLLSGELHVYGPFATAIGHALMARRQGRMKDKFVTLSHAALKEPYDLQTSSFLICADIARVVSRMTGLTRRLPQVGLFEAGRGP